MSDESPLDAIVIMANGDRWRTTLRPSEVVRLLGTIDDDQYLVLPLRLSMGYIHLRKDQIAAVISADDYS